MSKELIERLRNTTYYRLDPYEAADRIEQLEAEVAAIKAEAAHWKSNHATEVRRARILKERTDMPIDRVAAYEKWKEDQNLLSGFYDLTGLMQSALEEDTARIGELREQLAASQAREQQLLKRVASTTVLLEAVCAVNPDSACAKYELEENRKTINSQSDTTALEAMIAKAGEGMRERAIQVIESHRIHVGNSAAGELACEWTYEALKEIRGEIRTLPGVTLDDLK